VIISLLAPPANAATPLIPKEAQDVTILDVFDVYTQYPELRSRYTQDNIKHTHAMFSTSVGLGPLHKAPLISPHDGHQNPMALESMFMESTNYFDADEYRRIFFDEVGKGALSGNEIQFFSFPNMEYASSFKGEKKPLRGDIVRLTRVHKKTKQISYLYMLNMGQGQFPHLHGSGNSTKRWFFAYPFKNQIEFNTMPPRLHDRLVAFFKSKKTKELLPFWKQVAAPWPANKAVPQGQYKKKEDEKVYFARFTASSLATAGLHVQHSTINWLATPSFGRTSTTKHAKEYMWGKFYVRSNWAQPGVKYEVFRRKNLESTARGWLAWDLKYLANAKEYLGVTDNPAQMEIGGSAGGPAFKNLSVSPKAEITYNHVLLPDVWKPSASYWRVRKWKEWEDTPNPNPHLYESLAPVYGQPLSFQFKASDYDGAVVQLNDIMLRAMKRQIALARFEIKNIEADHRMLNARVSSLKQGQYLTGEETTRLLKYLDLAGKKSKLARDEGLFTAGKMSHVGWNQSQLWWEDWSAPGASKVAGVTVMYQGQIYIPTCINHQSMPWRDRIAWEMLYNSILWHEMGHTLVYYRNPTWSEIHNFAKSGPGRTREEVVSLMRSLSSDITTRQDEYHSDTGVRVVAPIGLSFQSKSISHIRRGYDFSFPDYTFFYFYFDNFKRFVGLEPFQ
jgi:hypothetical protein